jgi:hypothetical protein
VHRERFMSPEVSRESRPAQPQGRTWPGNDCSCWQGPVGLR